MNSFVARALADDGGSNRPTVETVDYDGGADDDTGTAASAGSHSAASTFANPDGPVRFGDLVATGTAA